MKQYIKLIMAIMVLAFSATHVAQSKGKTPKSTIYAFAYGTNFNDSTAYISAISALPNIALEPKTKFLQSRSSYSLQLKQYLEKKYGGHFMSAANRKGNVRLIEIPITDFALQPVKQTDAQQ